MIGISRRGAAPLLAAALLAVDAVGAAAQQRVIMPERDQPLRGTVQRVFAVGAAEGREYEMFGEVTAVAFDGGDNLYVLDRTGARVLVFDRAGRFVRQIGKQGQGPGEFEMPMSLAITGDGTVVVFDVARPGYSLFRPDGTFIRSFPVEGWMPTFNSGMTWHPGGGVIGTFRQALGDQIRGGSFDQTQNATPLLFVPLDGGAPRNLFNVPSQWRVQGSSSAPGQVQVRLTGPPMFSPPVLTGVLPDGQVALAFSPGYTVQLLNSQGQPTRFIQRPMRVRRTTDADRERARERERERMQSGRGQIMIVRGGGGGGRPPRAPGNDPQAIERRLQEMEFADTIPALRGMRVTPSGKLWIERTAEDITADGPIDIVTAQGEYLGTIRGLALPDAVSRSGLAAFIEEDEDGVQRVVVRRLPEEWR